MHTRMKLRSYNKINKKVIVTSQNEACNKIRNVVVSSYWCLRLLVYK